MRLLFVGLIGLAGLVGFTGVITPTPAHAQKMSRAQYAQTYREAAIREMHRSGVPASITLAQGMLESDLGGSPLAQEAKNHFGIKCHGWTGQTFHMDDDAANECFRSYSSVLESYADHSDFLKGRPRYANLFALEPTDYEGWAKGLKAAGYATNPNYPQLLIKLIEDEQLHQYDLVGLNQIAKLDSQPMADPAVPPRTGVPEKPKPELVEQANPDPAAQLPYAELPTINGVKFATALKDDNPITIAERYERMPGQIIRYNDLQGRNMQFKAGDKVFMQPKRPKAETSVARVEPGETVWSISQHHGVKLANILKYNQLVEGDQPAVGESLYLRTMAPVRPKLVAKDEATPSQSAGLDNNVPNPIGAKPAPTYYTPKPTPPATQAPIPAKQQTQQPVQPQQVFEDGFIAYPPSVKREQKTSTTTTTTTVVQTVPVKETVTPQPAEVIQPKPIVEPKSEHKTEILKVDPGPVLEKRQVGEVVQPQPSKEITISQPASTKKQHEVVTGDTMYGISKRYGLTVERLKELNGLTTNDIKIGQLLIVE